jgi:hypothetical protein
MSTYGIFLRREARYRSNVGTPARIELASFPFTVAGLGDQTDTGSKWRAYSESNRDSWFRGPAPFALDDRLKLVGAVSTRTDISQLKGLVFYQLNYAPVKWWKRRGFEPASSWLRAKHTSRCTTLPWKSMSESNTPVALIWSFPGFIRASRTPMLSTENLVPTAELESATQSL